jgi:Ribbon-helix-helix protein, copG family
MSEPAESGSGKGRKRPVAKAATGPVPGKVKATIHLSGEADKRLSVHATMMEMDRSELVESLIMQHLRRYVVSDRQRPDGAAGDDAAA